MAIGEELVKETRRGTVNDQVFCVCHSCCVRRCAPQEGSASLAVPSEVPKLHRFAVMREDEVAGDAEGLQVSGIGGMSVGCSAAPLHHSVER